MNSTKYLEDRYILVCIDSKKVNRKIHVEIEKASTCSSDRELIFSEIKKLLKAIKVITDFKYANARRLFNKDSNCTEKLVLKCNKKVKENRMDHALNKRNNNARVRGNFILHKDNVRHEKFVTKVIKINDSKIKVINYVKN